MGVDFVGSDGTGQDDGKKRSSYDVEYTTPISDKVHAVDPKVKTSFFDRFRTPSVKKSSANQRVMQASTPQTGAQAIPTNTVSVQPTTVPKSTSTDKAYAIVEHQETAPAQSVVYQATPAPLMSPVTTTTAQPSVTTSRLGKKAHIIPPPPPPPVHSPAYSPLSRAVQKAKNVTSVPVPSPVSKTSQILVAQAPTPLSKPIEVKPSVQSTAPVASIKPVPPVQPVFTGAPVTRVPMTGAPALTASAPKSPVPTVPVATKNTVVQNTVSGTPHQSATNNLSPSRDTSSNGQTIVSLNVSAIKGEMTQPQASVSSGFSINLMSQYAANGMSGVTGTLRLARILTITIWVLSMAYAAMVGYQGYAIFRNEQVQQQLIQLNTEIESYQTLHTTLAETNVILTAIQELLNQHVYWSNWFVFLEKYTLPNVYYTDFSGSSTGSMSLSAVTNNFESVTQQINVLRSSALVKSVEVNTATRTNTTVNETSSTATNASDTTTNSTTTIDEPATTLANGSLVHFTLTITVKPELFYYQPRQL